MPEGLYCNGSNWGYCAPQCSCTNGTWNCIYPGCPVLVCPPSPPPQGSACQENGFMCGPQNFGGYCSPTCTCDNGAWNCTYPPCPPPPPCPATQPGEYSQCFEVGQECSYYYGCSSAYCTCETPGSWFCSVGNCEGGIDDDGGIGVDF
jgi:hypothetical protein